MKLSDRAIAYCERYGIYEVLKEKGNRITYYSYYLDDLQHPFVKVIADVKHDIEISRKRMRYVKCPKFLKGKYNYCTG